MCQFQGCLYYAEKETIRMYLDARRGVSSEHLFYASTISQSGSEPRNCLP